MVTNFLSRPTVGSYILFLFLFDINPVLSIRIGRMRNTTYIASAVGQSFLNITCIQCKCVALEVSAVGWNCIADNNTCQLVQNYSGSDTGFMLRNGTSYYFQQLPSESSTTSMSPATTTTTNNMITVTEQVSYFVN